MYYVYIIYFFSVSDVSVDVSDVSELFLSIYSAYKGPN